ncbi:MAG: hypothetical protein ABIR86_01675 [Sphingomicrobium sp.]
MPYALWRLQGFLWAACIVGPIAIAVLVVSAVAEWFAPNATFSRYLEVHYWSVVVVVSALFFFYWFFRLVWDGLHEPTVDVSAADVEDLENHS